MSPGTFYSGIEGPTEQICVAKKRVSLTAPESEGMEPMQAAGKPQGWPAGTRARGELGQEPSLWFSRGETGTAGMQLSRLRVGSLE